MCRRSSVKLASSKKYAKYFKNCHLRWTIELTPNGTSLVTNDINQPSLGQHWIHFHMLFDVLTAYMALGIMMFQVPCMYLERRSKNHELSNI